MAQICHWSIRPDPLGLEFGPGSPAASAGHIGDATQFEAAGRCSIPALVTGDCSFPSPVPHCESMKSVEKGVECSDNGEQGGGETSGTSDELDENSRS
nr:hypothetical protein BaRGS_000487 [Batillaria attramentaria]